MPCHPSVLCSSQQSVSARSAFVSWPGDVITEVVLGEDEPVDHWLRLRTSKPSAKCGGSRSTCCCGHCIDWKTVPGSIRPLHRPGNFTVPPTGCGYYSLTDALHGNCRDKPRKNGYPPLALMPPSFFDADFRYVESLPDLRSNIQRKTQTLATIRMCDVQHRWAVLVALYERAQQSFVPQQQRLQLNPGPRLRRFAGRR